MTTAQIFACAVAWSATIVAVWTLVKVRRAVYEFRFKERIYSADEAIITFPVRLPDAEVEAFKERWLATYGTNRAAHPVVDLNESGSARPIRSQRDIDEQIAFTDAVCEGIDRAKEEPS